MTTRILMLVFASMFAQVVSADVVIPLNEEQLKISYLRVKKNGFPDGLRNNGSMKKEYEPFLWKVLGDKEMRQTWVFAVALIGKTGDEKSLEKLFDWVVKNFPEWHAGERNSENIGVVRALTDFSNRGFLEATYIILSGTTTEFWRWLIGLKWPKTELDREILIQLAIQCSDVLPNLTHPEARTLIEFFGLRK